MKEAALNTLPSPGNYFHKPMTFCIVWASERMDQRCLCL